jgi:ATP-binding cassette subfamily F protein 3
LLDEPTNHLDLDTTRWLEEYLRETDKTILLISHDRAFMAEVVDHVLHMEGGSATPYAAGYEQFIQQRLERRLSQQRAFDKQSRVLSNEEDYIRRNIAGQNSKQAKGRRKRLERVSRLSPPIGADGSMSVRFEVQERGGDQVVVANRATVAIEDRTLIRDFTGVITRGDRIGLVGPNGAGKSTLLKTLMGEREPTSGTLRSGNSITVAYYRQDLAQVPKDKTLFTIISDLRPTWERGMVYGHLGRFGFSGDETLRVAGTLSGGERARIALAMMMLSRANLLVFDEPTNHLDVESIEALEDAIEAYEGTVLVVSHDRALLRALCTRVWVLHAAHITDFDGGFGEWEVASEERAHAARVTASEEESLRRVHEKKQLQRETDRVDRERSADRQRARTVATAEADVARWEAEVAKLTKALEDPDLYATPEGVTKSAKLGKTLDAAKRELDDALQRWTEAVG